MELSCAGHSATERLGKAPRFTQSSHPPPLCPTASGQHRNVGWGPGHGELSPGGGEGGVWGPGGAMPALCRAALTQPLFFCPAGHADHAGRPRPQLQQRGVPRAEHLPFFFRVKLELWGRSGRAVTLNVRLREAKAPLWWGSKAAELCELFACWRLRAARGAQWD